MLNFERRTITIKDIEAVKLSCSRLVLAFGFFLYKPLDFLSKEHVEKTLRDNLSWPEIHRLYRLTALADVGRNTEPR